MRIIDLATLSMVGGSGIAEAKIPLFFADGTWFGLAGTSAGTNFIGDGSTSSAGSSASNAKLFTLSSTWPSLLQFAFEATFYAGSSSTGNVALWDMTSNTIVNGSAVNTTSTTATVIRSGKFTLTPNHAYGVTGWASSGSNVPDFIDASLIVFP